MNKKRLYTIVTWLFFGSLMIYLAYAKGWIFAPFDTISPKEAHTLTQVKHEAFLLDVRSPQEFSSEHIEGATLVPLQTLEHNLGTLPKDQKIVVYCQSGMRSVSASRLLIEHGYMPLNLAGGINNWKAKNYEVVSE